MADKTVRNAERGARKKEVLIKDNLLPRSELRTPSSVWRLLDANANRAREGLRVVEDTARFVLERPDASAALRDMRHRLDEVIREHYTTLLRHRDVESDPGRENATLPHKEGVTALLASNFKRCGEALRVL